jgi:hypothetical protein
VLFGSDLNRRTCGRRWHAILGREYDLAVTDLFGTLPSREESIDILRQALPDEFPDEGLFADPEDTCRGSTRARSSTPCTTAGRR